MAFFLKSEHITHELKERLKSDCRKQRLNGNRPCLAIVTRSKDRYKSLEGVCSRADISIKYMICDDDNAIKRGLIDANSDKSVSGIICDEEAADKHFISPQKDVCSVMNTSSFIPPFSKAVIELLDGNGIRLDGATVGIIGNGTQKLQSALTDVGAVCCISRSLSTITEDLADVLDVLIIIERNEPRLELLTSKMVLIDPTGTYEFDSAEMFVRGIMLSLDCIAELEDYMIAQNVILAAEQMG